MQCNPREGTTVGEQLTFFRTSARSHCDVAVAASSHREDKMTETSPLKRQLQVSYFS